MTRERMVPFERSDFLSRAFWKGVCMGLMLLIVIGIANYFGSTWYLGEFKLEVFLAGWCGTYGGIAIVNFGKISWYESKAY